MAEIVNIGALHRKSLEYKRQHLWVLSIDGLDAYTAQTSGRPELSLGETEQVNFVTTYSRYQANRGSWQPISMTLNDPINPSASKKMYDALLSQWNWETGRSGAKLDYAKDIMIKLLAPDFEGYGDNGGIVETWTLRNAFFSNVNWNDSPLDYDSTARLKVSFTVTYDAAFQETFDLSRFSS